MLVSLAGAAAVAALGAAVALSSQGAATPTIYVTYNLDCTFSISVDGGNLAVSGTAVWSRYRNRIRVDLRVDGDAHGRLLGSWNTNHRGARARLHGTVGGRMVAVVFRAP